MRHPSRGFAVGGGSNCFTPGLTSWARSLSAETMVTSVPSPLISMVLVAIRSSASSPSFSAHPYPIAPVSSFTHSSCSVNPSGGLPRFALYSGKICSLAGQPPRSKKTQVSSGEKSSSSRQKERTHPCIILVGNPSDRDNSRIP